MAMARYLVPITMRIPDARQVMTTTYVTWCIRFLDLLLNYRGNLRPRVRKTEVGRVMSRRLMSWLNRFKVTPVSVDTKKDNGALADQYGPFHEAKETHLITVCNRVK